MTESWTEFFVAAGGAAAALTGLLFIAVSLRPGEIRQSALMVGRARSAFYAFATITIASLLALAGTPSRVVGVAQLGVAIGALAFSSRFTLAAMRARRLNYTRAALYHGGLALIVVAGGVRALGGGSRDVNALLGCGVVVLLGIAMSNSWQLVLSHQQGAAEPS